ncbi:MAG: zf-TFIIB domain-containing protein [Chloroflexota bacterium]|nr:zf-TFIIB domain-containing protein [Chloroflexota bacterium]
MQCPIDGTDLVMSNRQGIEIDYCPKCRGVWLDRGELDKIIEREGTYNARPATPPTATQAPYPVQPAPTPYPAQPPPQPYPPRDDDDDDDDRRRYAQPGQPRYDDDAQKKKKRGFLGEVFDIF